MKKEESVLSVEQMKHLKDIGFEVPDETIFCYIPYDDYNDFTPLSYKLNLYDNASYNCNISGDIIKTLTLQEILHILPNIIYTENDEIYKKMCGYVRASIYYTIYYQGGAKDRLGNKTFIYKNELEACYNMLCYLVENKFLDYESVTHD